MAKPIVPYNNEIPYIEDRNPWDIPLCHLQKKAENEYKMIQGRRPSKMLLVNKLRSEVDQWRSEGYPGATRTSQELLFFWFDQSHAPIYTNEPFHFYFCQREAIETIVYLFEVKRYSDIAPLIDEYQEIYTGKLYSTSVEFSEDLDGIRKIKRYFPELNQEGEQTLPDKDLLRYAIKMATGSGKTFVMAFVVVWSYFNRLREKNRKYANNFLIVAPNVIVYERLAKDFSSGIIFQELPFIPTPWKSQWNLNIKLRGEESPLTHENNLIVNNIHQIYESRAKEFNPSNIIQAALGRKPQKDPGKSPQTLLERLKELDNLLVMNDEAHHVHDDELKWNESLMSIHNNIPGGLKMWLDFSATPKTPDNTYYPWIICDYPLAQAVEDRIVKIPLIVHSVKTLDPENITQTNVVQKYGDWITASLSRLKEHQEAYQAVGKKPVLFVMAEKNVFADKIAECISHIGSGYEIKKDEILVIHTNTSGDIKKDELELLRDKARDIDSPDNKIKVIVSVLMLKEGWDVQNVTIVLGLRAFDSAILPEQAIGRGLRLMRNIGPDQTQTLEVIGNDKFEKIVKQLELEGVGISTTNTLPPLPITIAREKKRLQYDIELPSTNFTCLRVYAKLKNLNSRDFPNLFSSNKLSEEKKIQLKIETVFSQKEIHQAKVDHGLLYSGRELVAYITKQIMKKARLTDCFQLIYPICEDYILNYCFNTIVKDIENVIIRTELRNLEVQEAIIDLLAGEIGKATVEKKEITIEGQGQKLSSMDNFTWRRGHIRCKKTVFNFVAIYNDFEAEFARFLDEAEDIEAFAALANFFRIDYLSSSGAIRFYFPDFVALQSNTKEKKIFWIIETKGREYPDLENKNKAIERWCQTVSQQSGHEWKYLLVKQSSFNKIRNLRTLFDLSEELKKLFG
ncbi:MAG TPA: DEAD/DEAH box helicase family protein [Caldisericia bacterium]|nr:DEAD/DEAH box helicase family protein [Caldisericia bacterium]